MALGRYEMVLRVAKGGMGEVWAARVKRAHGFQKLFALKVLPPRRTSDASSERMFLDEAELAARIRHPNVVPVVDLGEQDGVLFQVMEWFAGEPLACALRAAGGRPAPVVVAARIAWQVCAGLQAAHELLDDHGAKLGLVHSDVSPDNVLVAPEGLVRLVDFGVATYEGSPLSERAKEPRKKEAPPSSRRGAGGARRSKRGGAKLRGKVPYMAPEHILGRPSDRRADLFAVGVLLYELLSGEHPFLADDERITMSRIASARPAPPLPPRVSEAIPPAIAALVASALAKSPSERPPTAAAMMRVIEEAVPGAALGSSDALVAEWMRAVLGDALSARSRALRAALEALDQGASVGPAAPPEPVWRRAAFALVAVMLGCTLAGFAAAGDSPLQRMEAAPAAPAPGAPR